MTLKFEKPGKRKTILKPKPPTAKGKACLRCCKNDGTTVACHYVGIRQHIFGKGYAEKCHDLASVPLCRECHVYFDQPTERKSIERSEEFLFLIIKGWIEEAS